MENQSRLENNFSIEGPQYQIKSTTTTNLKVWKENEEFKLKEEFNI
jgi:hypothetical protein